MNGLPEDARPDSENAAGESRQPEAVTLRLLHVEDNPADAVLMQEYLRDLLPDIAFDNAARLSEVTVGRVDTADCVLLDLSLPDASGLDALLALRTMSEDMPIIVLTGFDNTELGLSAVRHGADDYLLKNHVDAYTLERAVQYAIERRALMLQVARSAAEATVTTPTSITAEATPEQMTPLVAEAARDDHQARSADAPADDHAVPSPAQSEHSPAASELLTAGEVAAILYVDPKTVARWASGDKIASVRTPGGHRRFFKAEILAMVRGTHPSD